MRALPPLRANFALGSALLERYDSGAQAEAWSALQCAEAGPRPFACGVPVMRSLVAGPIVHRRCARGAENEPCLAALESELRRHRRV